MTALIYSNLEKDHCFQMDLLAKLEGESCFDSEAFARILELQMMPAMMRSILWASACLPILRISYLAGRFTEFLDLTG